MGAALDRRLEKPGSQAAQVPYDRCRELSPTPFLAQRLSKAELARRLGTPRPSVDRLLGLRRLSTMDRLDAALECLDQHIELHVLSA